MKNDEWWKLNGYGEYQSREEAIAVLRKRVRFETAGFNKPGEHFSPPAYTQEIRDATRIYTESWIIPMLDLLEQEPVPTDRARKAYMDEIQRLRLLVEETQVREARAIEECNRTKSRMLDYEQRKSEREAEMDDLRAQLDAANETILRQAQEAAEIRRALDAITTVAKPAEPAE